VKKFELSLSPRYVLKWGIWEALREIMQNVIDREYEHTDAEKFIRYWPEKKRLVIGNRLTALKKRTLLMGGTDKADNEFLIGQYGEGYKLAMLVLLRNGCRIRIRTGSEAWAPAIEFSRDFDDDIIVVKIHKMTASPDLTFEITGIDQKMYKEFTRNCLGMHTVEGMIPTNIADILMEEQYRGKIFVEGLFVCQFPEKQRVRYGYNMRASHIQLDRDRRTVQTFNLFWEIGQMYASLDSTYSGMIHAMEKEKYQDTEHYMTHAKSKDNDLYKAICNMNYDDFFLQYGKRAIPVHTEEEMRVVKEKYNDLEPIMVSEKKYKYITSSGAFHSSSKSRVRTEVTPYSICRDFLKKHKKEMSKKLCAAFEKSIKEPAHNWKIR